MGVEAVEWPAVGAAAQRSTAGDGADGASEEFPWQTRIPRSTRC